MGKPNDEFYFLIFPVKFLTACEISERYEYEKFRILT